MPGCCKLRDELGNATGILWFELFEKSYQLADLRGRQCAVQAIEQFFAMIGGRERRYAPRALGLAADRADLFAIREIGFDRNMHVVEIAHDSFILYQRDSAEQVDHVGAEPAFVGKRVDADFAVQYRRG